MALKRRRFINQGFALDDPYRTFSVRPRDPAFGVSGLQEAPRQFFHIPIGFQGPSGYLIPEGSHLLLVEWRVQRG